MASFERRFLTIKFTKLASKEAEVVSNHHGNEQIVRMYIFMAGCLLIFVMILVVHVSYVAH